MSVVIETTLGDITVDLYLEQRPVTCLNFLKLCKMKYYNFNLFHSIRSGFIAQTGDPTAEGFGGQSIFGLLEGPEKRFFSGEKLPKIRHTNTGTLSMVCTGDMMVGSQFFFTLAPDLDSLDGIHCVIGEVTEGHDILRMLNDVICDETHRPYRDVRITHTVVLEDPFNDPTGLRAPSRSPSPSAERLKGGRIAPDEDIDEAHGKSAQEIQELIEEKEAKARATILEIVGDLPDADIAPPENVLFVCKLNPVTTDEDLEIIFSRFGKIVGCEVIRDKKTGDSLQYAFIEFSDKKSCEDAYFKMDNVLIDDRRIHVDFSQSVSRMRWMGKGKGIRYFNNESKDQNQNNHASKQHYKERGDHKNGSFDDFTRRKHENYNREHHRNKNDRENRDKERDRSRTQRSRSRSRVEKPGNKSRYDRERSTSKPRNIKTDSEKIKSRKERSSSKSRRAKDTSSNRDRSRSRSKLDRSLNESSQIKENKNKSSNRDRSRSRSKLDRSLNESSQIKENKNKSASQITELEPSRKERERSNSRSKTNKSHDESLKHRDKRHQFDNKYQRSHGRSNRNDSEKDNRHKRDHSDSDKITSVYERTKKSESSKDKSMKHCETDHSKIGESKISNNDKSKHKDDKEKSVRHRKENSNKNLEEKDSQSSKNITESKSKNSKMLDKSKKKNTKILKKKRKHSTSTSDSSSDSSSSESSSSSGGDKKKKSLKRRKKKVSTSSSSSSSSSSSTSSSSTDSSSSSSRSDSEPSRKKRKKVVSSKIVKTQKSKK